MKQAVESLAVHSRLLAKSLAAAKYLKRGDSYKWSQQIIADLCPIEKQGDHNYIKRLTLDLIFCTIYHRIAMQEYFLYHFESKTEPERHAYIGNMERLELCDQIGNDETRDILNDKYKCYRSFQEFYGRDVIKLSGPKDKAVFDEFISKHKEFIVKPLDSGLGREVCRINCEKTNIDNWFQKKVAAGKTVVVEQCVEQAPELARFHPRSVNTIRVATFTNGSDTKILFTFFRTGRGTSVVDNGGAGGLLMSVDPISGKIQSDGYSESGEVYQQHPDTGVVFKGYQIPRWQELIKIASMAAQKFPQHNYISWDLALTNSGWIMIEANYKGEFIGPQITNGGIRKVFMEEFDEYRRRKTKEVR